MSPVDLIDMAERSLSRVGCPISSQILGKSGYPRV